MKIYTKILIVLSLICIFTINIQYYSYGVTDKETQKQEQIDMKKKKKKKKIDTDITSDNFTDSLNPSKMTTDSEGAKISQPFVSFIGTIVNSILGFVQAIGGFLSIVALAIFGFGLLASSNKGLADVLPITLKPTDVQSMVKYGRQLLIGSVLLFLSATIVNFAFKIFNI